MALRPIMESEWSEYEWFESTNFGDPNRIFVRGRRLTEPPRDGFHYVEQHRPYEAVQVWKPALTEEPAADRQAADG